MFRGRTGVTSLTYFPFSSLWSTLYESIALILTSYSHTIPIPVQSRCHRSSWGIEGQFDLLFSWFHKSDDMVENGYTKIKHIFHPNPVNKITKIPWKELVWIGGIYLSMQCNEEWHIWNLNQSKEHTIGWPVTQWVLLPPVRVLARES